MSGGDGLWAVACNSAQVHDEATSILFPFEEDCRGFVRRFVDACSAAHPFRVVANLAGRSAADE